MNGLAVKHQVTEANKMWISWAQAAHEGSGKITLNKVKFYGPVLSDMVKVEDGLEMPLDLTEHFAIIIPRPYIVTLKWNRVTAQDPTTALIDRAEIQDRSLGCLKILTRLDKFLIDFEGHRTEDQARGLYKAVFRAVLFNSHNEPYEFYTK